MRRHCSCARGVLLAGTLFIALPGAGRAACPQDKPSDWPQFRGPGGAGKSAELNLPVTWGPSENVVWKVDLPGPGASSPIVVGSRVFLTCYSGYGVPGEPGGAMTRLRLHVVCLHRDEGRTLWTAEVVPKLPEQATIRENHGYASSTPAADGQRVYVLFGRSGVFAFDHEGRRLWRAEVGPQTSGWGSAASPVLFQDLLIVNASVESESLVALDRRTGKEVWRTGGVKEAWNTPVLAPGPDGKTELLAAIPGKLIGLEPTTGEQLWSCATEIGWYMVPSLVAHEGVVYCIGGRSGGALAVRLGGRGDVTATHRLWTGQKGSNVSSPVLHEGHLYWMHEDSGTAYCAEARTGRLVYEQRIERAGQVYASPVLADGKLYYVSRAGRTFVLAARPQFECLAINDLPERGPYDASPAVAGSRLFLRSSRHLYCLGRR